MIRFSMPDRDAPPASRPRSVADHVRALREQRGWTQAQLARAANLSPGTVSRVERGDERPRGRTAEALATALAVTADELLGLGLEQPGLFPGADQRRVALLRRMLALDDLTFEACEAPIHRALDLAEARAARPRRTRKAGHGGDGKSGA